MRWIFPVFLCVFAQSALARGKVPAPKPVASVKELAFPEAICALETLQRDIVAVGRFDGRVLAMPRGRNFVLEAPFRAAGKTNAEMFGVITDQLRREIAPPARLPPDVEWRSVELVGGKGLVLDGSGLVFIETDPSSFAEVSRRGVPWDTLKPPRDRGGEGTAGEIARFRSAFAAAYQKTLGVKVAGIVAIPAAWRGKGKTKGAEKAREYFAATRIAGHPLLELACPGDEVSSCVVTRSCAVSGMGDVKPEDIVGIAIRDRERQIIIGDASRKNMFALKYDSCNSVRRDAQSWIFPARMKELTNFSVDQDGWLWASAATPDDYASASVYCWGKGEW